ncbi:MGDG synthase family glycosyltransferase [Streptacidiphilus anmyonensis]|uniref:MGDG synthase family glycosyltransferase n=1 Tax=Streptacidiphilus anmyonensis TaxID=405782 RepID=UPI000AE592F4|nr:galactosyldiacylglycerol synthase [Streptacidiphilus anmyonensis]
MSRFLIVSASMGDGHDAVARALAGRLDGQGHDAIAVDVLRLLPTRAAGAALRGFYQCMIRHAPWVYSAIYAAFFRPGGGAGTSPLAAVVGPRLLELTERLRPDLVVPVFHLAAQTTGRERALGRLRVPTAVVVTDFAVHRQWLHPGNDHHLCLTEDAADQARAWTGRPARAVGAVLAERFLPPQAPVRRPAAGAPRVLLSAGAWGAGTRFAATARLLARSGFAPVVLCGRNAHMRRALQGLPGVTALGWQRDLPAVLAEAAALIDNAAGQTALQALALRVPVVAYRPLPGHGREGVRAMARLGLTRLADSPDALLAELRDAVDRPQTALPGLDGLFPGTAATTLAALAAGASDAV